MAPVLLRRRKTRQLARLIVALDSAACAERPWRPRRVHRVSLATSAR